jgi:hypothetical protein
MNEQIPANRSLFQRAYRAIAKVSDRTRKARPMAILCLAVLTLGTVCLTEVYGTWGMAARPQGAAASTPTFTVFDAPGAGTAMLQGTTGMSINAGGDIAGIYVTSPNLGHGFVRAAANGTITTFDAPNAGAASTEGTFALGINAGGGVAGMYSDTNRAYHGFVRAANGTITEFDVPGAPVSAGHRGTIPMSINTGGDIAGFYVDASAVRHGFVRSAGNGTFTTFDAAGAGTTSTEGTVPLGINAGGEITGFYIDASRVFHGFARAANGTITAPIDAPGASTGQSKKVQFSGTLADSINTAGDIAGIYTDTNGVNHGFLRAANGTTTAPIDAPGTGTVGLFPGTLTASINTAGDITGVYEDANGLNHGFLRAANGAMTAPLDAPGASTGSIGGMFPGGTVSLGINDSGAMTGGFFDANGVGHGFLLTTAPAPPPAATPTFSPAAGTYTSPQMVTISDATPGATIFFTTDGTTPTTSSTKFTAAIQVNVTETIKAIAAATGSSNSAVATATYVINAPAPDFQVSVNPTALTIVAGQSGTATFTVTPQNGFNSPVSFVCSGLPSEAGCGFNPPSVTPNGAAVSSTLTVTTTAASAAMRMPPPTSLRPTYALLFPVLAMMFVIAARQRQALRGLQLLGLLILLMAATELTSCGGGGKAAGNPGTPVGTSTASVSASGGGANHAANLTITITH